MFIFTKLKHCVYISTKRSVMYKKAGYNAHMKFEKVTNHDERMWLK